MANDQKYPKPLTAQKVARLKSLPPDEKPPEKFIFNLGAFRLPQGAQSSISKMEGTQDTFYTQITMPGAGLGKRVPYESIPAEPLTRAKIKRRPLEAVRDDGSRPLYLPVDFRPTKIKLARNELAHPPFNFKYRRGVDVPTNVFAPDERYIYQDTSFPWCTVGRIDTPLGTCTGCTIGSRLLLTANHCIQWNSNGTAGWVRFRPAYYNGSTPFGEAWATRVIFWIQTTPADGLTDNETAFDYVVCVLDTRMGDVVGYPGYRRTTAAGTEGVTGNTWDILAT